MILCDWHNNFSTIKAASRLVILGNLSGHTLEAYACRECSDSIRDNLKRRYSTSVPFEGAGDFTADEMTEIPVEKILPGYVRLAAVRSLA